MYIQPCRLSLLAALPLLTTTCLYSQTIAFSAPHQIPLGAFSSATNGDLIAAADMNGDGKTDLIVLAGGDWFLLTGDGKGDFTGSTFTLPADQPPDTIVVGDVNNDGYGDIITAYGGDPELYPGALNIYRGNGHGNFTLSDSLALPPGGYASLVLGDFNHDGKVDIAALTVNDQAANDIYTLSIFLNHGNGSFTQSQTINLPMADEDIPLVAGDFNGDGRLDLAYSVVSGPAGNGEIQVMSGNGNGTFRTGPSYVFDSGAFSLAAADLNHDGKTDLVVGLAARNAPGAAPRIATLLAKQAGGFYWYSATTVPSVPTGLVLSDLNGDGKLDIVETFESPNSSVHVLAGEGGGKFALPVSFTGYADLYDVLAAPLTKGGRPDLFFDVGLPQGTTHPYLGLLLNESK